MKRPSLSSLLLLHITATLALLACAVQSCSAQTVWMNLAVTGLGYSNPVAGNGSPYGNLYPIPFNSSSAGQTVNNQRRMNECKAAGADGAFITILFSEATNDPASVSDANDFMGQFFIAARSVGGIKVAPSYDFQNASYTESQKISKIISGIEYYIDRVNGHGGSGVGGGPGGTNLDVAATVGGKIIIQTAPFGGETPSDWTAVDSQLRADTDAAGNTYRSQIFWSLESSANFGSGGFSAQMSHSYTYASLSACDGGWTFSAWHLVPLGGDSTPFLAPFLAQYQGLSKPFWGGVIGQYDREDQGGGYNDGQATALLRQTWETMLANKAALSGNVIIMTLDDRVEKHAVSPDSEWSTTRTDVCAWYSHIWRGTAAPFSTARLYVTSPNWTRVGLPSSVVPPPAEGLVINPTGASLTVTLQQIDNTGATTGSLATTVVGANSLGVATLPVSFSTVPSGHFVRYKAAMVSGSTVTQSVVSAPVIVYDTNEGTAYLPSLGHQWPRFLYYSIPAANALPGTVRLTLSDPDQDLVPGASFTMPAATATVTGPAGITPATVDVLQNLREVGSQFTGISGPVSVPMAASGQTIIDGEIDQAPPQGFYVGRFIDPLGRVGYSDPAYVAPNGTLPGSLPIFPRHHHHHGRSRDGRGR